MRKVSKRLAVSMKRIKLRKAVIAVMIANRFKNIIPIRKMELGHEVLTISQIMPVHEPSGIGRLI
jgi:hypothetical protein